VWNFYDLDKFDKACRETYSRDAGWVGFLEQAASHLVRQYHPERVLVIGCVIGNWVEILRKLDVEAWGLALEEPLLEGLPETVGPYCRSGSISEPFAGHYDMVLCLDGLSSLTLAQAEKAVQNISQHGDAVVFSFSPLGRRDDIPDGRLVPVDWVELFIHNGLAPDLDEEVPSLFPWTILLRKTDLPLDRLASIFERRAWQLQREVWSRRLLESEQRDELSQKGIENRDLYRELMDRHAEIYLLRQKIAAKEAELQEVLDSRSWQFMRRIHAIRHRLIPSGSTRENLMFAVFRGLRIWRQQGFIALFKRLYEKTSLRLKIALVRLRYMRRLQGHLLDVQPVPPVPIHQERRVAVDIVVCVHNALPDVQRCLESVIRHTTPPYILILVDDGSDAPAREYLKGFTRENSATLLRNERATGYTRAANRGLQNTSASYVVLLNSDTVVTPGWLDRLVACAESDSRVGMVGPLSNTASWQSIPEIEFKGDWSPNPLPAGVTPAAMGEYVAFDSARLYPTLSFLNGFCLLIRRQVLDELGYFDEENFGSGYGEEDDYTLRARKVGWRLALADDAYVYHAHSRSYSTERRIALVKHSGAVLAQKHGQAIIDQGVAQCLNDRVLLGIRARGKVLVARQQLVERGRSRFAGKRLVLVLPLAVPSGGGISAILEARVMRRMGVRVDILNLIGHREFFEKAFPDLDTPVVYAEIDDIPRLVRGYDAVVATFNPSVGWIAPVISYKNPPVIGYYIQDYEPYFYKDDPEGHQRALDSYSLIPGMVRFGTTEWICQEVTRNAGVDCVLVGGTIDIDLLRPRPRRDPDWPDRPLRIAAMVRPYSHYRAPRATMEMLRKASRHYGSGIEIFIFGTRPDDPGFIELPRDFEWNLAGVLSLRQIANLLNEVDIFVDYSTYQGLGMTAMEAMSCGNAVIVPARGGSATFARHEHNCLVVDTASAEERWSTLQRLVEDHDLRQRLQRNATADICEFHPEGPAYKILEALFPDG
jgi:GT2 family glycosyltransferase/glycosyltransferase involved in cell wall biosynthesis